MNTVYFIEYNNNLVIKELLDDSVGSINYACISDGVYTDLKRTAHIQGNCIVLDEVNQEMGEIKDELLQKYDIAFIFVPSHKYRWIAEFMELVMHRSRIRLEYYRDDWYTKDDVYRVIIRGHNGSRTVEVTTLSNRDAITEFPPQDDQDDMTNLFCLGN